MKEARDPIACYDYGAGHPREWGRPHNHLSRSRQAGLLARCVKYIGYDGVGVS